MIKDLTLEQFKDSNERQSVLDSVETDICKVYNKSFNENVYCLNNTPDTLDITICVRITDPHNQDIEEIKRLQKCFDVDNAENKIQKVLSKYPQLHRIGAYFGFDSYAVVYSFSKRKFIF